jgi:hypothetical protein
MICVTEARTALETPSYEAVTTGMRVTTLACAASPQTQDTCQHRCRTASGPTTLSRVQDASNPDSQLDGHRARPVACRTAHLAPWTQPATRNRFNRAETPVRATSEGKEQSALTQT